MVVAAANRRDSVAEYLTQYQREYGYSPSVREIAEHEGISVSNAYRILRQMINDGDLRSVAGRARTWRLVDPVPF